MTAQSLRDALVAEYHRGAHEDDCDCPADFIAGPIDAIIAAKEAEVRAEQVEQDGKATARLLESAVRRARAESAAEVERLDATLGLAWQAAVDALDGALGPDLMQFEDYTGYRYWRATSEDLRETGDTPTAALNALAARLREARDGR